MSVRLCCRVSEQWQAEGAEGGCAEGCPLATIDQFLAAHCVTPFQLYCGEGKKKKTTKNLIGVKHSRGESHAS